MTQPTVQHRHDIWRSLCLNYGVISAVLWQEAIDLGQPVGKCTTCGSHMQPGTPEQRGARMFYPARCSNTGCRREVEGQGPRVPKPKKGESNA